VVPEKIRNVALVGHGGSGKTTLAEAMLFVGGATNRMGSIEQGTTTFDYEPEEIERGISLGLAVATVDWNGTRINILDSPGSTEFGGDARTALRAADLALFAVSAVDGVEVQTEVLWRAAEEEGIPRAIVITKLDRERASYERVMDELRSSFGKSLAPIQVPLGSEESLRGVVRVATERAYEYEAGSPNGKQVDLPDDVADLVHIAHTALIESVVETDDAMMEAYFEGT
jgi:elongation factor G